MNLLCSAKTNEICKSFQANLNHLTWCWLSLLENNPASLSQTAAVLEGKRCNDLNPFDAMQVKNFASGAEFLLNLVKEQKFDLSVPLACNLHSRVGKNEALQWGCLRTAPVTLRNIKFCPPTANLLQIISNGFRYLEDCISNPVEKAIATFLFVARNQPFYDANKRTASLLMNGLLMKSGFFAFSIHPRNTRIFHETLGRFYETGDANPMFDLFLRFSQPCKL
ncbi:MAG: Fic family protein [Burkholderiales bacterium]|nr:Fic family protein [Burkholderiales bacterium]